jgi:hypothetical protein
LPNLRSRDYKNKNFSKLLARVWKKLDFGAIVKKE